MAVPAVPLESLETFAHGLDHPEGICTTPDGQLYVGGEAGQVYRVSDDGSFTEILSTGGFMLGLAADADGRIYAIDNVAKCVWRIDPTAGTKEEWASGPPGRPFATPNWGAFDADGNYYLSDSGGWGEADGCLWRIPAGGAPEVWSEESANFPNGLAVTADGSGLYVLESIPGALVEVPIEADGSAGARRVLCNLDPAVPDGVAFSEDGAAYIACYRPDVVYRWHASEGLSVVAEDPRGTVLAAPTNVVFTGDARDTIVVPNIGRWHVTRIRVGVSGIALNYPTRSQLGS
ncbi:MAG: SMP-30/gluconolactonase/LRE family protein [Gaiellaceae bacterium]